MMRERTIREQVLPVLDTLRRFAAHGIPVAQACQMAVHEQAEKTGLTYQTIVDGLRRRLTLSDIGEFHRLAEQWLREDSEDLRTILLTSSDARAHPSIEEFFKKTEQIFFSMPPEAGGQTGLAEGTGNLDMPETSITIQGLDADVVAALEDRAARNHRTLGREIKSILSRTVRPDRAEMGAWSAAMRRRPTGRYRGDLTAEIRADRER